MGSDQLGRPVGYIRAKVHNRSILLNALIDSGNLFADLISEDLAKTLNLPIMGKEKIVGTASSSGSVKILGKTKPFKLYFECIRDPVCVEPYVVQDLAHPLNLGQAFLRSSNADMTFRSNGIQLRLNGSVASLVPSSASLTRASIDARIKSVLDKLREQGGNPDILSGQILDLRVNSLSNQIPGLNYDAGKKPIIWSDTRSRVYTLGKVTLKAGMLTPIPLRKGRKDVPVGHIGKRENDIFFQPKFTNDFMNKHELWAHPGCYKRQQDQVNVLVSNFSDEDVVLPESCLLGHIHEASGYEAEINVLDHRPLVQLTEAEVTERRSFIIKTLCLDDNPRLDKEDKAAIIQIFMENWAAISVSDTDYGKTDLVKFHIEVPKGTAPVRAKLRPLNPAQEKDLDRQLKAWTEAEVIEPSMSPWASALVPVKKKNSDKLRWCIDFRNLNHYTVKDAYPLASIEGNLHKLSGATVFSTLDSAGAFHNIVIDEESRNYTAFVTPQGQFRFVRVPFGLANAPAAYSRLVQMALDRLPPGFALGYIDDIIIHSQDLKEHIEHLRQVVALHTRCGMKLNISKCTIAQEEVEYLGHLVSPEGIRMIPSYVQRVLEWTLPKTGKELRSFLGFVNYYRAYIKDMSALTSEMNKMKNSLIVEWNDSTRAKFETLKLRFKESPLRGYPQYDNPKPFILDTDFSATNMAAVLSQEQNGKEVFLGCVAKKCNKAESNYPSHKGEMASVILGLKKFEHILRYKPFVIRTDSKCVSYLRTMKEYRGIYARWQCYLSSFNFSLVHRSGTLQRNADALSRMPGLEDDPGSSPVDPYDHLDQDIDDIYALQEELNPFQLKSALEQDTVLKTIMGYVAAGIKPDKEQRKTLSATGISYVNIFECLELDEGILYYVPPMTNDEVKPRRICLPLGLLDTAFKLCHSHPSAGHFGSNKTHEKMQGKFYFPNMYAYISARIRNCVPCVTKKSTMAKVLDNLDELGENLTYQDDFEDDEEDIRPPVYQGILPAGPPPSRDEPHEEDLGPDISGEELPTPGSDSQSGNDPTESDEPPALPSIKEETVLEENPTETESNSGSDRPASTLRLNSPRRALLAARAAIHRDSVQGRKEERNRRRNK